MWIRPWPGAGCGAGGEAGQGAVAGGAGQGHGLWAAAPPQRRHRPVLAALPAPQIGFNYLGRVSAADMPADLRGHGFTPITGVGELVAAPDADMPALSAVEINALVTDTGQGPALTAMFSFPTGLLDRGEVHALAQDWCQALRGITGHTRTQGAGGLTPSDLSLVSVAQSDIDSWEDTYGPLDDVWPVTTVQSGLLFHTLLAGTGFDAYHMQMAFHLNGPVDPARLHTAAQTLLHRHSNLRAAFVTTAQGDPVQVIPQAVTLPWQVIDLRDMDPATSSAAFEDFLARDRATHFTPATAPLLRLTCY
ncbi:hypothetical protein KEF29_00610 [Streptomyces tuirus]|uniref:Condensation domain-containing protein n=1 Tax=Streptomyces tuirus TaxID=68278 RepID=A0A941F865_9ACTN|nr:hypothetical protein [Streptomyces tuirus]